MKIKPKVKKYADGGLKDKFNSPIKAKLNFPDTDRSNYDHYLNQINLGNDYKNASKEEKDNILAHEGFHEKQYNIGRASYPEYFEAPFKKPNLLHNDDMHSDFYNRKGVEVNMDIDRFNSNNPSFNFIPRDLIYDKVVDPQQYSNPNSMEGEAQKYQETGKFQNGGSIGKWEIVEDLPKAGNGYKWSNDKSTTNPIMQPQNNVNISQTTGNRNLTTKEVEANKASMEDYNKNRVQEEYNNRKNRIQESIQAQSQPLSLKNLQTQSQSTGDKLSFAMNSKYGNPEQYPTASQYVNTLDYLNPAKFVGDMASGLGSIPQDISEGNYLKAGMSIASPLAVGAIAGIGATNTKQFLNNLVNPLAGTGEVFNNLGNKTLDNYGRKAFTPELDNIGIETFGKNNYKDFSNYNINTNPLKNLEDLQKAKMFAQKYGYELPSNLERIAKSDKLTDRTIRGMMDRHNTFVRGVSTNWDELSKKNPEILKHLEGKGFDLSTKEGTKNAAEYMATHIPISTGYGRASLDTEVFNRGLEGLYTSNSIPTAEGYTYGQGYITKVKKPTNYSSSNRQDWITQNNPMYKDEDNFRKLMYPLSEESTNIVKGARVPAYEKNKTEVISSVKSKIDEAQKELRQLNEGRVKYSGESVEESIVKRNKIIESFNEDIKYLEQHGDELLKKPGEYKILRTERSNLPTDPYNFLQKKDTDIAKKAGKYKPELQFDSVNKISEWLKTQPYQQKMREMNDLGESLRKYTWEQQKPIRDKIDILKKESNEMYNKSIQDYMKLNHTDYDPVQKYAHYIHIGTPGEKVLEPIKSWEITPELWKNKSRGHTNTYTKKLSAMNNGGTIIPLTVNSKTKSGWQIIE